MEEQNLTKKERRQLKREDKRKGLEHSKKAKAKKGWLTWGVVILVIGVVGFGIFRYLFSGDGIVASDPLKSCVRHAGGMHIHPSLTIVINGLEQEIPRNIGVSASCMRPLHTHDDTGRLHNEFPRQLDFTVDDFFKVWGESFSSTQILDFAVDDTHTVSITVNGEENDDYENLILRDLDRIEIRYEEIEKSE